MASAVLIFALVVTFYTCDRAGGQKSTRSKFWRQRTQRLQLVLNTLPEQEVSHMTTKVVTNTHRADDVHSAVNTIPPPSGRGEGSDGTAEFLQTGRDLRSWAMGEIQRQEEIRKAEYERFRQREQCRIWLEHIGSPLAPYTAWMQTEAERVGSNCYMCAAVSMAESSGALDCHGFNAWGLGGATNYRTFGSWEEGITAFYDFLYQYNISRGYPAVDGWTTPNYCEPPDPWRQNVSQCIRDIQAIEVAPYDPNP